jgi:phosphinothricin acetyltransferase
MSPKTTLIRPCQTADLPAVTAIYAHHVTHGSGSFELEPPSLQDMTQRHANVSELGLPWLVASRGDEVLGFAYAGQFRPRPGFRYLVEDSVYLHPSHTGQGLGVALLAELIRLCEQAGKRQMLAVIGDSANAGSIALHARLGFRHAGVLQASGWKHGCWLDTVLMQRSLGPGQSCDPE